MGLFRRNAPKPDVQVAVDREIQRRVPVIIKGRELKEVEKELEEQGPSDFTKGVLQRISNS